MTVILIGAPRAIIAASSIDGLWHGTPPMYSFGLPPNGEGRLKVHFTKQAEVRQISPVSAKLYVLTEDRIPIEHEITPLWEPSTQKPWANHNWWDRTYECFSYDSHYDYQCLMIFAVKDVGQIIKKVKVEYLPYYNDNIKQFTRKFKKHEGALCLTS